MLLLFSLPFYSIMFLLEKMHFLELLMCFGTPCTDTLTIFKSNS